jgi:hypothetical protein
VDANDAEHLRLVRMNAEVAPLGATAATRRFERLPARKRRRVLSYAMASGTKSGSSSSKARVPASIGRRLARSRLRASA